MRPIPVRRQLAYLLVLGLSGYAPLSAANADNLIQQARELRLWEQTPWHKLLHYKSSARRPYSQVRDRRFFLATNGQHEPQAELEATVKALFEPASLGDEHAQCRFVARLQWLSEVLPLHEADLPPADCAAFQEFRRQVQATRVTLIFPSYYLNSPSSMFGHTLLRLDPPQAEGGREWLSFAVNFGAEVDPNDNGMFYAFKGVTGGYPGEFKVDLYYKKIQEYNRDENRDIWEYPLDLNAAETERLILHLWELQGISFSYYFFDENCSYRVLELLEVARPGSDLTSHFGKTVIPIDTVRSVQNAGMVQNKKYRPAKGTVLRDRLEQIPHALRPLVYEISQDPLRLQQADVQTLAPEMQARLVEAAYKYLRYRQIGKARDQKTASNSFELLKRLRSLAAALPPGQDITDPANAPDSSHASRRFAAGIWSEDDREYLSLGLRLSLHSLEENTQGFLQGAQINLGNFELRLEDDGQVDIEQIDIVDIFSLAPRNRFFDPLSWSIRTGIERQWTAGREHRVTHVTGGAGYSTALNPQGQIYALMMSRLEQNHAFQNFVEPAAGLHTGILQYFDGQAFRLALSGEKFANGESRWRAGYVHNLRLSRNEALHFSLHYRAQKPENQLQIGLRYFRYF